MKKGTKGQVALNLKERTSCVERKTDMDGEKGSGEVLRWERERGSDT